MKILVRNNIEDERHIHIGELLDEEYKSWNGKKIILTAPTGTGKTTFVIETLLPYVRERKKKMLILCNRKLLRMQYWFELIAQFERYAELESCIEVMTYQKLSENVKKGIPLDKIFYESSIIVCDECHYFYADSDFNSVGTFALLQIIIQAGIAKTMLFMSATTDEVKPLIEQTIKNCIEKIKRMRNSSCHDESRIREEIISLNFSDLADFSRFSCYAVPEMDSLCEILAESDKKSVIFIDSKEKEQEIHEKLIKSGKLKRQDICILNAENLDSENPQKVVQYLAISHKVLPKILITTSVLDNGISIHDADVGNLVVIAESKISFLQMLGRIRVEKIHQCNLYFLIRGQEIFRNRMNNLEQEIEKFKKLEELNLDNNRELFFQMVWNRESVEMDNFYRKAVVIMKRNDYLFTLPTTFSQGVHGDTGIYINEFAKRKTGDLYLTESRFYSMAMNNSLEVIFEQMRWIGKEPGELQVLNSTYREKRKTEFIQFLLSVQNYTKEEMQEFKKQLVQKYRQDFFPEIFSNNGTLSTEKMKEICAKYGLQYITQDSPENRRKIYNIKKKNADNLSTQQCIEDDSRA
ncbi:MAG: DEAD/DEAH box helicase family protein [Clostridium sp.]|nr:DEAD/DEAH box helicase family protein [Clostridium sp.]